MNVHQSFLERLCLAEKVLCETPIVPLADDRVELYAKLEFLNGVGSIKDRPALWMLKRAIERGEIGPHTTIIESSSGNLACSLSSFCALLGLTFVPVIDPNVSPVYESYLRVQCRNVVKVEELDSTGGYLQTRLRMVERLRTEIEDSLWTNQYSNSDAMESHYHLTGGEICRALPRLDYVFVGVGSGGTLAGVSRRIKERHPAAKVIAVDVEGSVIFGQCSMRRHIPGIGSSIRPPLVDAATFDEVVIVSEPDTVRTCHRLLAQHGLFVGGSSGSAYCAVQTYFRGDRSRVRPVVLFLCCDRGGAYLHNIYNPAWAPYGVVTGSRERVVATVPQ
jgi:N-(2-amino-2-carboxyethyl)-L-glutamate synthase